MSTTAEIGKIRRFVKASNLETVLDNLPPLSDFTIINHTSFESDHPYILFIGECEGQTLGFGLTTTPAHGRGPSFTICSVRASIKLRKLPDLDVAELKQPFKALWENTSTCTGSVRPWADSRRGMLKALAYWYLLAEAERAGHTLVAAAVISKYMVDALRKLRTGSPASVEAEANGNQEGGEPNPDPAETSSRRTGAVNKDETDETERPQQSKQATSKKRARKSTNQTVDSPATQPAKKKSRRWAPQDIHKQATSTPKTQDPVSSASSASNQQSSRDTNTNTNATTDAPDNLDNGRRQLFFNAAPTPVPFPVPASLQTPRARQSSRQSTPKNGSPGDEFGRMKQLLDVEASLKADYHTLLAQTQRSKKMWDDHKEVIRKAMAESLQR